MLGLAYKAGTMLRRRFIYDGNIFWKMGPTL